MRLFSYLVSLLVVMSLAISDSESESLSPGEEDGGDIIPETQAQTAEVRSGNESDAAPRRSSRITRITRITRKRLAGWPVHRILEALYARNISVPSGLNHEELFCYLMDHESSADAQELNATATAKPSKGKAPAAKRRAAAAPQSLVAPAVGIPSKRSKRPEPSTSHDATILSSLLDVKSALNVMNARILSLEENANSAACHINNPGPSTFEMAQAAPLPADVTPHRTLGTAVPAPSMGSRFLPPAAAIPDSLRNHILAGSLSLILN